jgi:hypothetical protein
MTISKRYGLFSVLCSLDVMQTDSCTPTRKAVIADICTTETIEAKVSCRISTRGMKLWSIILHMNPSGNGWTSAIGYPQGIRNKRVRCQLEKTW